MTPYDNINVEDDIGSGNGLLLAITWTNADLLSIGTLGTNPSEISIKITWLSFKKMYSKMSSARWWPSCRGHDVLCPIHLDHFQIFLVESQHWKVAVN